MSFHFTKNIVWRLIIVTSILMVALWSAHPAVQALASQPFNPTPPGEVVTGSASSITTNVYVPLLLSDQPWISPFGVESNQPILSSNGLLAHATNLNLGYARMGHQISWAELQPAPGVLIDWGKLASFENELRELKQAGITPIVTIKDTPVWAQMQPPVRDDGQPTSCSPIAEDFFDEFASFVQELVFRYEAPEFNVHIWEIGNEPDVDPNDVRPDSVFGCWGDNDDSQYFGGFYYGQMLRVVSTAIKQADSTAQVWVGGLLLDRPITEPPLNSHSEKFFFGITEAPLISYSEKFFIGILEEIRESGAGSSFDVIPYHAYSTYWDNFGNGKSYDYDIIPSGKWYEWGGSVVGKARFLRQLMAQYGVDKPVFLNEGNFGCPDNNPYCAAPGESFYESQATHLVRYFIRGLSENVSGYIWYTLDGPGWRFGGLLDENQQPRLAYTAYQVISQQLQHAHYVGPVDYAPGIEAYAFRRNSEFVHVVWAKEDTSITFYVPADKFIQAIDRDGNMISVSPPPVGADYELQAGFDPIYVIRRP